MADPTTTISGAGRTTTFSGSATTRVTAYGWILGMGDSKTAGDSWLPGLTLTSQAAAFGVGETLDRGVPGASVLTTLGNLAVVLAPTPRASTPLVLINLGVNDIFEVGGIVPAVWSANYLALVDAVRAIWPLARIYLARPWQRGQNAVCATMAALIAALVPQRANLFVGMDEQVWLQGSDDGATMTVEGVHYSVAGEIACTQQWATVLWS